MQMPFGKYGGEEIEDLPTSYLLWLSGISLHGDLYDAVVEEITARGEEPKEPAAGGNGGSKEKKAKPPGFGLPIPLRDRAKEMIRVGYRELAKRHHPDVGGATVDMQQINATVEALLSLVDSH